MLTPDDKIKTIKEKLDGIAREMQEMQENDSEKTVARGEWMAAIKHQLSELGQEHGYQLTQEDPFDYKDHRTTLCDLTWQRCKNKKHNNTTNIELAAENVWSNTNNLKRQFLKLVHLRAELKLFIFETKDKNECKDILAELKKLAYIRENKHRSKYLFSCFVADDKEFIHIPKILPNQQQR